MSERHLDTVLHGSEGWGKDQFASTDTPDYIDWMDIVTKMEQLVATIDVRAFRVQLNAMTDREYAGTVCRNISSLKKGRVTLY